MFGMSLGEMVILGVVAIVVVGPRNLPSMLRSAGQLIGRVRKMATDIRAESGIDEILEVEGIRSEIETFRKLATGQISPDGPLVVPDRDREYPPAGPDTYGAESEDLVPFLPTASATDTDGVAVANSSPLVEDEATAPPTDGASATDVALVNGGGGEVRAADRDTVVDPVRDTEPGPSSTLAADVEGAPAVSGAEVKVDPTR